jgi:hypothetical protein
MDDRVSPRRLPIELFGAIMSLLSDEPFHVARVLAVRLSSRDQTVKRIVLHDLGMRKSGRRWMQHHLSDFEVFEVRTIVTDNKRLSDRKK